MFSGYSRAIAHKKSMSLKDSVPKTCEGSGQTKFQHGEGRCWQLIAAEREKVSVFKNVTQGGLAALHWDATHPRVYKEHKLHLMGLSTLKKVRHKVG